MLGELGQDLISYSDDQWSANVGVGRKFSEKWSGTAMVNYDTGAGNPVTTLDQLKVTGVWALARNIAQPHKPLYKVVYAICG